MECGQRVFRRGLVYGGGVAAGDGGGRAYDARVMRIAAISTP
jgi:hypothetical protein